MVDDPNNLTLELKATGSLSAMRKMLGASEGGVSLVPSAETTRIEPTSSQFESPYRATDISPFAPSGAVYFMDGGSDVTFRLRGSTEEIRLDFTDQNTSISASKPLVYTPDALAQGLYVPVPPPLDPIAHLPKDTPARYTRHTTMHLMQVISMNMRNSATGAKLLIGLPYAERFPSIFYQSALFPEGVTSGASYGVVQSLTEFNDPVTQSREVHANGYPARSFFAIYHILETSVGTFFNKKATQMELQPGPTGKLALKLPPIPFLYSLINGPIPLYDVNEPTGEPVGEVIAAHHRDAGAATIATRDAWPYHAPDLQSIAAARAKLE